MTPMPLRTAPAASLGVAMLAALAGIAAPTPVKAQAYVGEIIMGGWNFCPSGSAHANGQLLPIAENETLFALLGTRYGGDGINTFALPDLRGRAPLSAGTGVGIPTVTHAENGGRATVTLTQGQIPQHSHLLSAAASGSLRVASVPPNATTAEGSMLSNQASGIYTDLGAPGLTTSSGLVQVEIDADTASAGGNQPFDNREPFLGMTYCIMLFGIFPSPS